jgi:3-oxocholest-4-en-26-oyl-CoA dehydrogenase beta subunit
VDLNLEDRHREIREVARNLLESRCPLSTVRELETTELGYSPDLWQEMGRLDWIGLTYPPEVAGAGGGLVDLAMIYMEMGRALAPSPHLASAVICGRTLLAAAGNGDHGGLLHDVVTGHKVAVPALLETSAEYGSSAVAMPAMATSDGFRLSGTKLLVPFAHIASHVLVATRTDDGPDGVTLLLVDPTQPGVIIERLPNIAGHPLFALHFDSVEVPRTAVVGEVGKGWSILGPALDRATVLRCAEIVGAGERLLNLAVGYAQQRVQFGTPIGHYQAVQYLCTDIAIDMHLTSLFTLQAAWLLDYGSDAGREVAMAKAYGSVAAQRMVRQAHEVYAGAGFMLETDLQLFTRRAKHWEFDLGEGRYHREMIAAALES